MSFKSLLVHVDQSEGVEDHLKTAFSFAVKHDAHVTGLGVFDGFEFAHSFMVSLPADVAKIYKKHRLEGYVEIKKLFEEISTANHWQDRSDWVVVNDDPVKTLDNYSRYHDLVVVRQPSEEFFDTPSLPDSLVLQSVRPLLLLPRARWVDEIGRNVLIAWNGGREAARAITDALPILKRADNVTLVNVNAQNEGKLSNFDMTIFLERHGVKVGTTKAINVEKRDITIGGAVLDEAARFEADLIVMGAYGHSRFREYLLGGVTNHLLKHSTLPVFMAH